MERTTDPKRGYAEPMLASLYLIPLYRFDGPFLFIFFNCEEILVWWRKSAFSSPSVKKQYSRGDELGSCLTLVQRHRFLLTALALLAFLCTIYLYFAVTLGAGDLCSGLTGTQKASCRMEQAKASVAKGKLKFF
ncbi:hypothetical protein F0562_024509 [Nyssa sinensis]|uniref:Uncharacterized protein n=1 Tax=Nyssa sinensis TaxID=561372 RepID=A0A5J5BFG6_9ASTE|nr:hypothetical protein F0562_024509 [Nyssa sinensis]